MNKLFVLLCVVFGFVGVVYGGENLLDRLRSRGRCREIRVQRTDVVVRFTCREDAELFAEDLKHLTRDQD